MNQQELVNKVIDELSKEIGGLTKDVIVLKTQLEMMQEQNVQLLNELQKLKEPKMANANPDA